MTPTQHEIRIPKRMAQNFAKPARNRVFPGGRGSGKTRGAAVYSAHRALLHASHGRHGVILASREHLNSLEESSLEEIKAAIRAHGWMLNRFDIGERYVRTKCKRVAFAFAGLRHNLDSIKSKAQILDNWTDEAEGVSASAWDKLLPTIRAEGSENIVTYNPESGESATHRRFISSGDSDTLITTLNWRDNPWFPAVLEIERLRDQRNRPDTYEHVWEGGFLSITDAQVFKTRYDVAEFEPGDGWDGPYYGVDFGFAQDPTTAVEVWLHNGRVHVRREAGKVGLELDDTAPFLIDRLPGIERHTSRADSARPESISYLSRHGLPRITGVKKGAGSVEDGVSWIKSAGMTIHPDCPMAAREARLYSHKVDRLSGDILPAIVDDHNHFIDSIRYALQPLIRARSAPRLRRL